MKDAIDVGVIVMRAYVFQIQEWGIVVERTADEDLIDDRGDRTPILFNRQIMRMLKVSVNPERKYIITTKYNLD